MAYMFRREPATAGSPIVDACCDGGEHGSDCLIGSCARCDSPIFDPGCYRYHERLGWISWDNSKPIVGDVQGCCEICGKWFCWDCVQQKKACGCKPLIPDKTFDEEVSDGTQTEEA